MTLQERLRACCQCEQAPLGPLLGETADALDAKDKRIEELEGALRGMIDHAEFWINREDRRGMSEGEYKTWLALGHESSTMQRARAALKKEQAVCPRCQIEMKPSKAIEATWKGQPEWPGDTIFTQHPAGPGRLVDCLKCPQCGFSRKN